MSPAGYFVMALGMDAAGWLVSPQGSEDDDVEPNVCKMQRRDTSLVCEIIVFSVTVVVVGRCGSCCGSQGTLYDDDVGLERYYNATPPPPPW